MASITLGKIDLKILQVLQENDHLTNVEPSKWAVLLSPPCLCRLKQLKDAGIIRKYTTLLSPVTIGLDPQAFIRVSISKVKVTHEEFSAAVQTRPEMLSCFALTDKTDHLLHAFFIDMDAFSHFVLDILLSHGDAQDVQSGFVLKETENITVLPLMHLQRN